MQDGACSVLFSFVETSRLTRSLIGQSSLGLSEVRAMLFDMDRIRAVVIVTACLFLTTSCETSRHDYPMAGKSRPLGSLSNAKGSAPPVARDVTSARIAQARSEPHNWLTYYGAYDGWRYSPLSQITR